MGKTRELIEKAGDRQHVIVAKLNFIWGKMRTEHRRQHLR